MRQGVDVQRKALQMSLSVIIYLLLLFPSSIFSFDDSSENVPINTGETATFTCDLPERYANKPAEFYGPGGRLLVSRTGEHVPSDDQGRYLLEHTYAWTWSLIFSDVSDEDAGEYTCRVRSDDRTLTIIKRFNLTVLTPPKIVDITIESNRNGILLENEQVILKCLARGNPPPTILWNFPGKKSSIHRNLITYENKLLIRNFSRTTARNYQCIADNGIPPRDTRTSHLVPAIPPEVTIQTSLSRFSSQILLNCTIIARPLTSAKWKQNRLEIQKNVKRIEINDFTIQLVLLLQINSSQSYGMYECEAENRFKVAKAFIIIDDSILSNTTTRKPSSSSSPSYAQFEILLNSSSSLKYDLLMFLNWLFLMNYCNSFYTKR